MHQSVIDALPGFFKQYEGKVNFMYLDLKGLVTVGLGHLCDPVDQALKLEFGPKGGGGAVGGGEVTAEFNTVKARTDLKGQGSAAFDAITHLQLSDNGIATMAREDAASIEKYLTTNPAAKPYYANFRSWPADAQLGILGIAWGVMPIPNFGWHDFPVACRDENWLTAAKQCRISSPIAAGRNEAHELMFMNAAAVKSNKDDYTELVWPLRRGTTVLGEGNLW